MIWRMKNAFSVAPTLAASLSWLAVLGCQVHSSAVTDKGVVERRAQAASPIADDVLRDRGLQTLWWFPGDPQENTVVRASLVAGGLIVATAPSTSQAGRVRFVERASGETRWSFELEPGQVLEKEPKAFLYPVEAQDQPNEFYLNQLDTLYILDLRWGDPLAKQSLPFPISTAAAATEDRYFVGSDNGRLYAVDKDTHVEAWNHLTGGIVLANPLVTRSSVIAASEDGAVYRFSPTAGWVRNSSWRFDTGGRIEADPVSYSQWILVGSTDYKLYCLEERDGTPRWTFLAEAPIKEAPVVYSFRPGEEYVYCVSAQARAGGERRTLFAVSLRDGSQVWRREGVRHVASMGRDTLYVINDSSASGARTLSGLDVRTGEEKFVLDLGAFRFVPTNRADHGRQTKERGRIYLVAADGSIQVLGERF